jgi:DNA-binding NarL/FixJ family response regulator
MELLLVDDHPLFGVGFAHALASASPGTSVHTALTLAAGLQAAAHMPDLDVVLIDYRLGEGNGLDGLREFGARLPWVARVLISGDEDPAVVAAARAAGASGFLGKSQPLDVMRDVLQTVVAGGAAFGAAVPAGAPRPAPSLPGLRSGSGPWPTARQMEVLALVAQGQQNKRIASELGIAERTVKLHVTALLESLGARNRTQLALMARERGLL